MNLTPDAIIIWQTKHITINATIFFTWLVMIFLVLSSRIITSKLSSKINISKGQNLLEILILGINNQIEEVSQQKASIYLPFIGTLFIFIAVSNFLTIIPGYQPPTGSLSTTVALAICVFIAVPFYGIKRQGIVNYFKNYYLRPTPIMLPFNIIGRFSNTISLAVRLFGNVMSGTMIIGILLSIVPLFFPVVMQVMGLLTGLIQAYIFSILAIVYIAAATQIEEQTSKPNQVEEIEP